MSWLGNLWRRLGEIDKEYDNDIKDTNTSPIEAASKKLQLGSDYVEIVAGTKKRVVEEVKIDTPKAKRNAIKNADKAKKESSKGLARA